MPSRDALGVTKHKSQPGLADEIPSIRSNSFKLWLGIAVIVCATTAPRLWYLSHGLPALATTDEVATVSRTDLILQGHFPATYDWPTGSMVLLAGVLRFLGLFHHSFVVPESHAQFVTARLVSALAGSLLTLAAAVLAHQLTRGTPTSRRIAAWSAALVTGAAYTVFRMSGYAHPEIEQALFATAAMVGMVAYLRRRRPAFIIVTGALCGLAAASKYIGVLALPIAIIAIACSTNSVRRRLWLSAATVGASCLVFIAFVPGSLADWSRFWNGVDGQFLHQSGGHLGYDSSSPALGFHLTQSIRGSIGWPLAIAVLAGAAYGLIRGPMATRLVALFVVVELGALGLSHVLFPHYILIFLPALIAVGLATIWDVVPARNAARFAVAVVTIAAVAPSAIADLRLLASYRDPDTRVLAAPIVAGIEGRVIKESYTDTSGVGEAVSALGLVPDVVNCHCYVVISSYMEDRYRREPVRYQREVSVYDELRARGTIIDVIKPTTPLSYRWDLLPQWGEDSLPLKAVTIGPEITILKLP